MSSSSTLSRAVAPTSGFFGHGLDNVTQTAQPSTTWQQPAIPRTATGSQIRPQQFFTDQYTGSIRQQGRDADTISLSVVGTEHIGDYPCLAIKVPMFYVAQHMRPHGGKFPQMLFLNLMALNKLLRSDGDFAGKNVMIPDKLRQVRATDNPAEVLSAFRYLGYMKHAKPSANISGSMAAQEATFSIRGDQEGFNIWVGCGPEGLSFAETPTGCRPHVYVGLRLARHTLEEGLSNKGGRDKPRTTKRARVEGEEKFADRHDDDDEEEEVKEAVAAVAEAVAPKFWAFEPVAASSPFELTAFDDATTVTIPVGFISEWYSSNQSFAQSFLAQVLQLPSWQRPPKYDKNKEDEQYRELFHLSQLPRIKISLTPIAPTSRFVCSSANNTVDLADPFE